VFSESIENTWRTLTRSLLTLTRSLLKLTRSLWCYREHVEDTFCRGNAMEKISV
jgi:hypothetical protein